MNPEQNLEPGQYSVFDEMEQTPLIAAGNGLRFVNFIVDRLVIIGLIYGITYADSAWGSGIVYEIIEGQSNIIYDHIQWSIIVALLYSVMEGLMKGKSIGKLLTGTRAVRNDDTEFTFKDAVARSFCRIVPFEEISIFFGAPWHDKWVNTTVVKIS